MCVVLFYFFFGSGMDVGGSQSQAVSFYYNRAKTRFQNAISGVDENILLFFSPFFCLTSHPQEDSRQKNGGKRIDWVAGCARYVS